MDLRSNDPELAVHYRRLSFYVLSMAAPLIWGKLLTVFDVYPFFGTMQIVGQWLPRSDLHSSSLTLKTVQCSA